MPSSLSAASDTHRKEGRKDPTQKIRWDDRCWPIGLFSTFRVLRLLPQDADRRCCKPRKESGDGGVTEYGSSRSESLECVVRTHASDQRPGANTFSHMGGYTGSHHAGRRSEWPLTPDAASTAEMATPADAPE